MVTDSQGRIWHCRHEATWHNREEMGDANEILARLEPDFSDVGPMYRKLFDSGHGTTDGTMRCCRFHGQLNSLVS